jgi:hypothetical protein
MDERKRLDALKEEDQRHTEKKRPYEKPKMTAVRLFAGEVLGGGCNKNTPPVFADDPCQTLAIS